MSVIDEHRREGLGLKVSFRTTSQHILDRSTLPLPLNDLEERGLLESTLVVWMGEFGSTRKINGNISRDHWLSCCTALLPGGGVKHGYLHGASDEFGVYPDRDGARPDDHAATLFALLGIDPHKDVSDRLNRPLALSS